MAIRTVDVNPMFSTGITKEVLRIEAEIDRFLIDHTRCGKAAYMISTSPQVVKLLASRYSREGWNVKIGYTENFLTRLEFEDPNFV